MRIDLGYATAMFHRGDELGSTAIAHSSPGPAGNHQPTLTEPAALAAVEGNRWPVVLAGYPDHRPGPDHEEPLQRMRRCIDPIRTVADVSETIDELKTYRLVESRRRAHSRLNRFPGGLAIVGDALPSVNPAYGQSLTLSALAANALDAYLRSAPCPRDPARTYIRLAETVVESAWQLSTAADLAQPHVTGPYPPPLPHTEVGRRQAHRGVRERSRREHPVHGSREHATAAEGPDQPPLPDPGSPHTAQQLRRPGTWERALDRAGTHEPQARRGYTAQLQAVRRFAPAEYLTARLLLPTPLQPDPTPSPWSPSYTRPTTGTTADSTPSARKHCSDGRTPRTRL